MFFIGIFGIENKDKEIQILNNLSCKKCNTIVSGRLIKNFDFFHFFFIPLFKWNEKYYVVCDNCRSIFIIPREKGKAIENGDHVEITYWDLQEATNGNYSESHHEENVFCRNCGKKVDPSFQFCPHCGAKI
jgi:hypothetical protein